MKLYSFIIELMNKIDKLLLNEEFLKNKFNIRNKQFKRNIYSLKTNVIIYCFFHPKFYKGRLIFDIPKLNFFFKRVFTPGKFYKKAYKLEKCFKKNSDNKKKKLEDFDFNKKVFDNFDFEIKNKLESKFPICKLITLLPFINCFEIDLINSEKFVEILKGIKLRKDEKNIYFKKEDKVNNFSENNNIDD